MRDYETVSLMNSGKATEHMGKTGPLSSPQSPVRRTDGSGTVLERGDKGNRPSYSRILDGSTA
jgi:hypothetical protein